MSILHVSRYKMVGLMLNVQINSYGHVGTISSPNSSLVQNGNVSFEYAKFSSIILVCLKCVLFL